MTEPEPNFRCFNLFHSQACSGFGAAEFCPSCGERWKVSDRPVKPPQCPQGGECWGDCEPACREGLKE